MKVWKSIVEARYFSSVLVGQDIMPDFKNDFANEFGISEDKRVSYLDYEHARKLVEEPITQIEFRGDSVSKVLEYTACSPYYTMMFCDRLVDYMNDSKSNIVTSADVVQVARRLTEGNDRLSKDKFDNLITAGDGEVDSGINPAETLRLCSSIAKNTRDGGWCGKDSIAEQFDSENLELLLSDMERRDVLEKKQQTYRIKVDLFKEWLLVHE